MPDPDAIRQANARKHGIRRYLVTAGVRTVPEWSQGLPQTTSQSVDPVEDFASYKRTVQEVFRPAHRFESHVNAEDRRSLLIALQKN